jgi:putative transposase
MYPTNLTDAQWQRIEKHIPNANRKRKHDLRQVWNALLYLVKTGCQWRMIPKEFPSWQVVYYYYNRWQQEEVYDVILEKIRIQLRVSLGQNQDASVGIIDSQTVRSANNKSLMSIDGNKKVKGIKRHVVVDKNGWLLTVMVSVAHIHDSKAAELLMRKLKEAMWGIKLLIGDGGYRGELIDKAKTVFNYVLQIVMRNKEEKNTFKPLPMRWVIERTFSWFDNDRRLCRNYELLFDSAESMVKLSAIKLLLNKI